MNKTKEINPEELIKIENYLKQQNQAQSETKPQIKTKLTKCFYENTLQAISSVKLKKKNNYHHDEWFVF